MSKIFNIKDQKSMKRFDELQLQRSNNFDAVSNDVIEIISKIRDHGDDALVEYTNRFDKNKLILDDLIISKNIIDQSINNIDEDLSNALRFSYKRIYDYHKHIKPENKF